MSNTMRTFLLRILAAGSLTLSLSLIPSTTAFASNVRFVGTVSYTALAGIAVLKADRVENFDTFGLSGTLHMELWAFSTPYSGNAQFGYKLAQHSLGQLSAGYYFYGISSGSVQFLYPPNGTWSMAMLLTEYTGSGPNNGFATRHWVNFSTPYVVGPISTPPSSPTLISATPGNGSITLAFSAGYQGSGLLLSYDAECFNSITTRRVSASVSPIVVSNLTNGQAYSCHVRTNTTDGTSAWSTPLSNIVPASPPTAANYSDLWWGGTVENGWGMTVQQHGNTQFNVFFVYDGSGKPIWYAMPGGAWNSNFTVFSGGLAKPTSAPLANYNTAQFNAGVQVGTMAITYTSANTAVLNYTINGISGTKNLQRQLFGPVDTTPGLQVGDMWWGGTAQNGWGVSITQQYRTLFAAWYTYDANGNVTWFTLPGGTWSGNTYSGTLATATSSPWLGGIYNPAQFTPAAMGTVSFAFTDANNAVMTYTFTAGPFAGTTQTKQLVRQPY